MRHDDSEPESPYYPPRATVFSPLRGAAHRMRRQLRVPPGWLPANLSFGQLFLGFAVPGYAYRLDRLALVARLILIGWVLGLVAFLFLLTAPPIQLLMFQMDPAYLAFGLMISLHSTSANYLAARAWELVEIGPRILGGILITAFLIGFIYFPAWELVQRRLFLPVRVRGTTLIVNPRATAAGVRRGDVVLYHIAPEYGSGVYVREGMGLQTVLGMPGDRIEFEGRVFRVNGRRQLPRPEMPADGGLVVPEKHWFIWPDLDIGGGHGNVAASQRQAALLRLAVVNQEQFEGRPYQRWLFWNQAPP